MPRRSILIGFAVIVIILFVIGLISGPLGQSVFGDVGLPGWLSVSEPHFELPAEVVFHILGLPITNRSYETRYITCALKSVACVKRTSLFVMS